MKLSLTTALACALTVQGHAIFQRVSINGQDKGLLTALRAPSSNNPVLDVTSSSIVCGTAGSTSTTVLDVAPGDKIGGQYQHLIGGPQGANDADNPIAKSHKGPVMAYLAKVDNAATTSQAGLKWFKIWEDTFDTSSKLWGVDHLLANNGWVYFNLPTCIAAGQYLLKVEVIALHSAYSQGAAQFYSSCAQIKVSGSGSFSPSSTVSFPGAYSATDPGIKINIYGKSGNPDNDGKPYAAPGPDPITC